MSLSINRLDQSAGRMGVSEANSATDFADAFAVAVAAIPSGAIGIQCTFNFDAGSPAYLCQIIWRLSA